LRMFLLFDAFVSVSPKLQEETSSIMPKERCELVPYGITLPGHDLNSRKTIRARYGIPDPALVLIFMGGLCARKDPMLLVRSLPDVLCHHPDTWLMLVGPPLEPDYVAEMKDVVSRQGTIDRVIFVGEVANPHPFFAAADIMTFASHQEGFGMVVPEAQANGLPVVVRHLPGVNDLFIKDGETGFLFTDDQGYLSGVQRLAGDPALRRRIGQQACDFVRRTFDMSRVARRYLSIYGFPGQSDPQTSAPVSAAAVPGLADIGYDASIVNPRFFIRPDFHSSV
jgi:glycosyltransferase involved in cell wall biosynthesis